MLPLISLTDWDASLNYERGPSSAPFRPLFLKRKLKIAEWNSRAGFGVSGVAHPVLYHMKKTRIDSLRRAHDIIFILESHGTKEIVELVRDLMTIFTPSSGSIEMPSHQQTEAFTVIRLVPHNHRIVILDSGVPLDRPVLCQSDTIMDLEAILRAGQIKIGIREGR